MLSSLKGIWTVVVFALCGFAARGNDFALTQVAKWPNHPRGPAVEFCVEGNFAYVAMDYLGVTIVDVSDPMEPKYAGWFDTAGLARATAMKGDVLYVADGYLGSEIDARAGLLVVDASDKTNPRVIRNFSDGDPKALWRVGDELIVVGAKVQIYDIAQPLKPRLVGESALGTTDLFSRVGLALDGNRLFVASRAGLDIVDISDRTNPAIAGRFAGASGSRSVAVRGEYAYVSGAGGVLIIDARDAAAPRLVGTIPSNGTSTAVAIQGSYLVRGDTDAGMQVFGLADPERPELVHSGRGLRYPSPLRFVGDRLYAADAAAGLQSYDFSQAPEIGSAGSFLMGYARDIEVVGKIAFFADGGAGVPILDVNDPLNIREIGRWNTHHDSACVEVRGDFAYIGEYGGGLKVVDIEDLSHPRTVLEVALGNVSDARIAQNFLLAVVWNYPSPAFIAAFDISDPAKPVRRDWPALAGYNRLVAASDRYVYLSADDATKLGILDLEAPGGPAIVGVYESAQAPNSPWQGTLRGNYLYVAGRVFDVRDKLRPLLAGSFGDGSGGWQSEVRDDYLYWAASERLHAYQLTTPTAPISMGSSEWVPSTEIPAGIAVVGEHALVRSIQGVRVYDLTQPANPQRTVSLGLRAPDIGFTGNRAVVARRSEGLAILDVTDPNQIRELGRLSGRDVISVAATGNWVYAAVITPSWSGWIEIIDITDPSAPREAGRLNISGAEDLMIDGDWLYFMSDRGRANIVDISNRASPRFVNSISPGAMEYFTVEAGKAFIVRERTAPQRELEIFDVTQPTEFRSLSRLNDVAGAGVSGNTAYVSMAPRIMGSWLSIFDVTDGVNPRELGRIVAPPMRRLERVGEYLYCIESGSRALRVYDVSNPANITLVGRNAAISARIVKDYGDRIYAAGDERLDVLHHFRKMVSPLAFTYINQGMGLSVGVTGIPGLDLELEGTADLIGWDNLGSFRLPSDGNEFIQMSPEYPAYFFRLRIR